MVKNDYDKLINQLFEKTSFSMGNPTFIFTVVQENLDMFNDDFLEYLDVWLLDHKPTSNITSLNIYASEITNFALLIQQVPFGNREIYLELSIVACEFLLQHIPIKEMPYNHIVAMNILGLAYLNRLRGDKSKNIENTIDYLKEFLNNPYSAKNLLQRAATYNNLGEAYLHRIHGDQDKNIEESIIYIKESLKIFDKEHFSKDWANSQLNLGCALIKRNQERKQSVETAIQCFKNALSVYDYTINPIEWANTQKNIAEAFLLNYNFFEDKIEKINKAISLFDNCLKVYNNVYFPELWTELQIKIAIAYKHKFILCNDYNFLNIMERYCINVLELNELDITPDVNRSIFDLMAFIKEHRKKEESNKYDQKNLFLIRCLLSAPTWREAQRIVELNSEQLLSNNNLLYMEKLISKEKNEKTKKLLFEIFNVLKGCCDIGINKAFEEKIINVCLNTPERLKMQPDFDKIHIDSKTAIGLLTAMVTNDEEGLLRIYCDHPEYSKIITDKDVLESLLIRYPDLAVFLGLSPEEFEVINEQEKIIIPNEFEYILIMESKLQSDSSDSALNILLKEYNKILNSSSITKYPMFKAYLLYNLSSCYLKSQSGDSIDHLNEAINYIKSAINIINHEEYPIRYGYALCLLGKLYGTLALESDVDAENTIKAMSFYQKAALFMDQSVAPNCFGSIMIDLGEMNLRLSTDEDKMQAIAYYLKSLSIYTSEAAPLRYAYVNNKIGKAYLKLKNILKDDIYKAIQCFKESLCFYTPALPFEHAESLYNLGVAYTRLSQFEPEYYQKAQSSLETALKYFTSEKTPKNCMETAIELGNMYFQKQDWHASFDKFNYAREVSENKYYMSYIPESKQNAINTNVYIYNHLILLCWKLKDNPYFIQRALEFTEAAKARTFLEQMSWHELLAPEGVPADLMEIEKAYIEKLKNLEKKRLYENAPNRISNLSKEILDIRNNLEDFWKKLENQYPSAAEYVKCRKVTPPDWKDIINVFDKLQDSTAIVSFYFCYDQLFIFILKKGIDIPFCFSIPVPQISDYLYNFHSFIQANKRQKKMYDHLHKWIDLGNYLLQPFEYILKDIQMVYFIPHCILHSIPIHALKLKEKFFIEEYYVGYSPTIAILNKLITKKSVPIHNNLTLIMAYEPNKDYFFLEEAKIVADIFASYSYTDNEATVECLSKNASMAELIHISCHGQFCENVFQSNILLANDKRFTVKDWMNLNLKADLVTLSACQTGSKKIRTGDEMDGLTKALFYTGVNSTLLTLWEVDAEKTMIWMKEFYSILIKLKHNPNGKFIAFRDATIKLINSSNNPYMWAPFILIGRGNFIIN